VERQRKDERGIGQEQAENKEDEIAEKEAD